MNNIQFLAYSEKDIKFQKLMFIKKGGEAIHAKSGENLSRDYLDVELICVSNEIEEYWIGNYAEGIGIFNIKFLKSDCREATNDEVNAWIKDYNSIKF